MNTIRVSATKARNNFFELLNQVAIGAQIIIARDNKEIAVLTPPKKQTVDWVALRKASRKVHGIWKDYNENDNPLRRPGASDFLGKWDKQK